MSDAVRSTRDASRPHTGMRRRFYFVRPQTCLGKARERRHGANLKLDPDSSVTLILATPRPGGSQLAAPRRTGPSWRSRYYWPSPRLLRGQLEVTAGEPGQVARATDRQIGVQMQ